MTGQNGRSATSKAAGETAASYEMIGKRPTVTGNTAVSSGALKRWRREVVRKIEMRLRVVALLSAASMACVAQNDPRLKKLEEIEKLQSAVTDTAKRLDGITLRLNNLELQVSLAEERAHASASFDPAENKGYSRIDTTTGAFLVSIENVTPYVDGFKVTCNFGNPSTATYNGFKLKAKWGPRFDLRARDANYSTWQATLREKEFDVPDHLQAGAWNHVSFVLSPAKADEFGYLELSMDTNSLSLRK